MSKSFGVFLIICGVVLVAVVAKPAEDTAGDTITDKRLKVEQDLPKCSPKDSECMRRVFNAVLPTLKNGNADLNIPPLDPFLLNTTTFQYMNGGIKGRVTIKNTKVYGISEGKMGYLDVNIGKEKTFANSTFNIGKMEVVGDYKADGEFNNARFKPKGTFKVLLTKIAVHLVMKGEVYDKDGRQYVRYVDYDINPKIGGFKFEATGIFPDPELNQIVNNVVNQYWEQIIRIMVPETKRYWGPLFLSIANEVAALTPLDDYLKSA